MSTDFVDELVRVVSRTTREITRTTREFGARAEQTIETQKIRNKIAGEEKIIEKIKVDMGNIIYKRHEDGAGIDSELSALCQEIDQHLMKIREYKDNAASMKGKKVCPSCGKEVNLNVSFCPYCGTSCPTPEPADTVEDADGGSFGPEAAEKVVQAEETEQTERTMEEEPEESMEEEKKQETLENTGAEE